EQDIFSRVQENKIKQIAYLFKNIEEDIVTTHILKDSQSLADMFSDKNTREQYEKSLSLLLTPSIKYMYILSKDSKDRFRFLLDASKSDKANFYQKFDVENPKYEELYATSKPQVIKQKDMENLYLTYLYPIVVKHEVIGILSVDITTKIHKVIAKVIKPLETFFVVLIIFIFLLMLMSILQVFHYFRTRKKIFTDPLTQLFNRNYLVEISPMLNLNHYSIAMLDLDRFKVINDTYGHKTGDFVLSTSAQVFKNSIRESDILIRYGGEEFLLFIYKRDEGESANKICERIRKNIDSYSFNYENQEISVQVSIGVHESPSQEKNLNEAIKIADKMLYIAKTEGRNRVVFYNDRLKNRDHFNTKDINFVKLALEENRVLCYYQPIYDPINKKIHKYEALVRIQSSEGEIIPPASFLPNIKHTNIHYKLTKRILSIVFDKLKHSEDFISINMNFSDLINKDIENSIIEIFQANKELASRVTFEILESDEIDNIELLKEKIDLLYSFGAKVSIDDFGSGYSNFRTILDIEAKYIKIDGTLIKNIDKNEKDFKVVKSIIHFAKETNMKTIAEFVHSKEVYDQLKLIEIDYMQGYFISKPTAKLSTTADLFNEPPSS
ncbi:MAG: EAL domain-containing protein, partial [Campylobacterota bacterium]|nr:EAL domain-containing protein [Campylobacterota bacterium]